MRRITDVGAAVLVCAALLFAGSRLSGGNPSDDPETRATYAEGPPPAHTGGFGEPSCHECHFDGPLNDATGVVELEGVPGEYSPGESHTLTVRIRQPDMQAGGFQLAARFAEGEAAGAQAGRLVPVDGRVAVVDDAESGVQYAQHTEEGSAIAEPGAGEWTIEWIAPADSDEPVLFDVAANAANGDNSEFGDYIFTASGAIPKYPSTPRAAKRPRSKERGRRNSSVISSAERTPLRGMQRRSNVRVLRNRTTNWPDGVLDR